MKILRSLPGVVAALLAAAAAHASSIVVNLDTSALANHPAGPFYLDFQSIYGSGSDQSITVSNFQLTGGGFIAGTEGAFGAVSGDLASALTLAPGSTSVYNEFFQQFEAGVTAIRFNLDYTTNAAGLTPTSFAVFLLDGTNLWALPTTGFADTLVLFNLDGANSSYATGVTIGDTAGASASVPDTGASAWMLIAPLGALGLLHTSRRRLAAAA